MKCLAIYSSSKIEELEEELGWLEEFIDKTTNDLKIMNLLSISLPIYLNLFPSKFPTTTTFCSFIWVTKSQRTSFQVWQRTHNRGGLNVPNLKFCFLSAYPDWPKVLHLIKCMGKSGVPWYSSICLSPLTEISYLPSSHLFRFFQIRHIIQMYIKGSLEETWTSKTDCPINR